MGCRHLYISPLRITCLLLSVLVCAPAPSGGEGLHHRHPPPSQRLHSLQEVEQLKKTILRGLGLTRIPDVTKMNVSQQEYSRMYNEYLRSKEENQRRHDMLSNSNGPQPGHVKAQRFYSFTHANGEGATRARLRSRVAHRTWLRFPVQIPESRVHQVEIEYATLRLLVSRLNPPVTASQDSVQVRVFQVLAGEEHMLVDQRAVRLPDIAGATWTELDVTRIAQAWNAGDSDLHLGLVLECPDCARMGVTLVTEHTLGGNSSVSPVLNILAGVHIDNRDKRSVEYDPLNVDDQQRYDCSKDGQQKCCRHVMKVNFKDIQGFEFIIQPKEFDAGYCKGRCPPRYNPAHHHALLQSLIWKQQSRSQPRIPRVCCAPSRLRELEVLHLDVDDPSKLKLTVWDNMQVLDCACS